MTRGSEFHTPRPKWVEYCSKGFIMSNKRNLPAMKWSCLRIGGGKCRFTNTNATNAVSHLKSWSLPLIKRGAFLAPPVGMKIRAGSCPLFPADLPLVGVWEPARYPPALPLASLPEAFSSFTAVSCTNMR